MKAWRHVEIIPGGFKLPVLDDLVKANGGTAIAEAPPVPSAPQAPQPGEPRPDIQHPGIRGGKWYRDKKTGKIRYGVPPTGLEHEALDALGPQHIMAGATVTAERQGEPLSGTVTKWGHAGVTVHVQNGKGDFETRLGYGDLRTVSPPGEVVDPNAPKTAKAKQARTAMAQAMAAVHHQEPHPFGRLYGDFHGVEQSVDADMVEGQGITWIKVEHGDPEAGTKHRWRALFKLTAPHWASLRPHLKELEQKGTLQFADMTIPGQEPEAAGNEPGVTSEPISLHSRAVRYGSEGVRIDIANPIGGTGAVIGEGVSKSAHGLVVAEVVGDTPEDAATRLHQAFEDTLGLKGLFDPFDPEAEKAHQFARAAWQIAPGRTVNRELTMKAAKLYAEGHGGAAANMLKLTDGEARELEKMLKALTKVQVSPGYSTYAEPGRGEAFAKKHPGFRGLLHDLHTVKATAGALMNGLYSTLGRWSRGLATHGASSESDMGRGSGDSVFTRLWRDDQPKEINGVAILIKPDTLDRTDWYAYHDDQYGEIDNHSFESRETPAKFLSKQHANGGQTFGNEVMVRRMIPPEAFDTVLVEPGRAGEIDQMLRKAGVTHVGGRPVDDVVQIGSRVDNQKTWTPFSVWRGRHRLARDWAESMGQYLRGVDAEVAFGLGGMSQKFRDKFTQQIDQFAGQFEDLGRMDLNKPAERGAFDQLRSRLSDLHQNTPLEPDDPKYDEFWDSMPPMGEALLTALKGEGGLPAAFDPAERAKVKAQFLAKKKKQALQDQIHGVSLAYMKQVAEALRPSHPKIAAALDVSIAANRTPPSPGGPATAYLGFFRGHSGGTGLLQQMAKWPGMHEWADKLPPLPPEIRDYALASDHPLPDFFLPQDLAMRKEQSKANMAASQWHEALTKAGFQGMTHHDPAVVYTPAHIAQTYKALAGDSYEWEANLKKLPRIPPDLRPQVEAHSAFPAFLYQDKDSDAAKESLLSKRLSDHLNQSMPMWNHAAVSDGFQLTNQLLTHLKHTISAEPKQVKAALDALPPDLQAFVQTLADATPSLADALNPNTLAVKQANWEYRDREDDHAAHLNHLLAAWKKEPGFHTKGTVKRSSAPEAAQVPAEFLGSPHLAIRTEVKYNTTTDEWVPKTKGKWYVVHAASGERVTGHDDKDAASLTAWRLGRMADWSASSLDEVKAQHPGLAEVTEAIKDDPHAFVPQDYQHQEEHGWIPPKVHEARQKLLNAGTGKGDPVHFLDPLTGMPKTGTLLSTLDDPTAKLAVEGKPFAYLPWAKVSATPQKPKVIKPPAKKKAAEGFETGEVTVKVPTGPGGEPEPLKLPASLKAGLAVHQKIKEKQTTHKKGHWGITHAQSGLALGYDFPTQKQAEEATHLLTLPELGFDWTLDKDAVITQPFLTTAISWLKDDHAPGADLKAGLLARFEEWKQAQAAKAGKE